MFTKSEILEGVAAEKVACEERGEVFRASENLALLIYSSAMFHEKQWNGDDYAAHPIYVGYNGTRSTTKRIIGILHDVVEDTDWTLEDLKEAGFSSRIVTGVGSVTKNEGELYFDFIERCAHHSDGIDVKLNDLEHNMSVFRNSHLPAEKDLRRLQKYVMAKEYLVAVKKGEIASGTEFSAFVEQSDFQNDPVALEILKENSALSTKLFGPRLPELK